MCEDLQKETFFFFYHRLKDTAIKYFIVKTSYMDHLMSNTLKQHHYQNEADFTRDLR